MSLLLWFWYHWQDLVVALNAVLVALVTLGLLLPGPEPERTLQKVVDFLARFSRKP